MSDFDKQAGVRVPPQCGVWQNKPCHGFLTARQGRNAVACPPRRAVFARYRHHSRADTLYTQRTTLLWMRRTYGTQNLRANKGNLLVSWAGGQKAPGQTILPLWLHKTQCCWHSPGAKQWWVSKPRLINWNVYVCVDARVCM